MKDQDRRSEDQDGDHGPVKALFEGMVVESYVYA